MSGFNWRAPGRGFPAEVERSRSPCGINQYVISGQNVMAERWPGTSPDDPTHLCSSVGEVTGSPTASLCVPLSSGEMSWGGSEHSGVFASLLCVLEQKINQPFRRRSDGVLLTCALNGPLIKSGEDLDGPELLSA